MESTSAKLLEFEDRVHQLTSQVHYNREGLMLIKNVILALRKISEQSVEARRTKSYRKLNSMIESFDQDLTEIEQIFLIKALSE